MALAAPGAEMSTSSKALTDLPVELIQETAKHVHRADLCALRSANRCLRAETLTFFREAFFTNRWHKVAHKSLETLYEITRIYYLCKDLSAITFELVACANVKPELLVYILGAFKNLHERGTRFSVGVHVSEDKWESKCPKFMARFIGNILALSASTQCLSEIFVMLPEDVSLGEIWDDRRNDAIRAHLATGNDLSFLWPDLCDVCACYKSEDHSLILKWIIGTDQINDMFEKIGGCIDEAIIKPLEKLYLEGCITDPEDLMEWLGLFPEIKELSVVETKLSSFLYEDWEWHHFLEAVMEMENSEVLVLKDNEFGWDWVSSHTEYLYVANKTYVKDFREGSQNPRPQPIESEEMHATRTIVDRLERRVLGAALSHWFLFSHSSLLHDSRE